MAECKFSRAWAMPSSETFSIGPIADLLRRWIVLDATVIDPFARNAMVGTIRNDLNPATNAENHMDAEMFARGLKRNGVTADVVLFDPPYSPRQVSECYQQIGRTTTQADTQNSALYSRVRRALAPLIPVGGLAISFGWNSSGFGEDAGFEKLEILLVCHGGAHNDTIVVVERRTFAQTEMQFGGR